ncbi:MAG: hypothetical protein HC804_12775 [Anaerolineae bacterium]|nr:hypothetical protein [Anaerolineae bacterium]
MFDFMVLPVTLLFLSREQPHWLALADGLQLLAFLGLAAWLIPLYGPMGAIAAKGGGRLVGFGTSLALLQTAVPHTARK